MCCLLAARRPGVTSQKSGNGGASSLGFNWEDQLKWRLDFCSFPSGPWRSGHSSVLCTSLDRYGEEGLRGLLIQKVPGHWEFYACLLCSFRQKGGGNREEKGY